MHRLTAPTNPNTAPTKTGEVQISAVLVPNRLVRILTFLRMLICCDDEWQALLKEISSTGSLTYV